MTIEEQAAELQAKLEKDLRVFGKVSKTLIVAAMRKAVGDLSTAQMQVTALKDWVAKADKAVAGLKANGPAFTGHPVVDCVSTLKEDVAVLRRKLNAAQVDTNAHKQQWEDREFVIRGLKRDAADHDALRRSLQERNTQLVEENRVLRATIRDSSQPLPTGGG
jgi:hypothetical protein